MSATNTFAELTANGQSASYELPGDVCSVDVYLADAETWGSGTLILQSSFDGGTTWVAVPSASWTSGDGVLGSYTVYGRDVRFSLSGATGPSLTPTIKVKPVASEVQYLGPLTDNGNTDLVLPRAGAIALFVKGTWDSGSLTLSISPDGTAYYDSGVAAITANGGGFFANATDESILRLVLASVAAAGADLDVWVYATNL